MQDKLKLLEAFISKTQLSAIKNFLGTEEKEFYIAKINEIYETIKNMPKTYDTDGQGDSAIVYLHYFINDSDFYITEKDIEDEQLQAFGLVSLSGSEPELGYVPISELIDMNVELDLYWSPKTLKKVIEEF